MQLELQKLLEDLFKLVLINITAHLVHEASDGSFLSGVPRLHQIPSHLV